MEPLKYEDLIPEPASFSLKSTGETYRFRMFSVADQVWIAKTFGVEEFSRIFDRIDWPQIARIMFHQLDPESQAKFKKQTVKFINEEGEEMEEEMGGAKLLLASICGLGEQNMVAKALAITHGLSQPVIDKMNGREPEKEAKKKVSPSTGQKSLTSSRMNTAGPKNTSSKGHREKSRTI